MRVPPLLFHRFWEHARVSVQHCSFTHYPFMNALLVQTGGITEILQAPGKLADTIQGISGTRNLGDNLSDLKAQVGVFWSPQKSRQTAQMCIPAASAQVNHGPAVRG